MSTILPARVPGPVPGWHTVGPMGRHVDAAGASAGVRRTALVCGLLGGVAWVATYFLDADAGAAKGLLWLGGVLLTVALCGIGMMLVKSDLLPLRIFVALALPTLVWGVFALIRDSVSDEQLADAVFGTLVGLGAVLLLVRRSAARRATL
jgi:hypothetical protein